MLNRVLSRCVLCLLRILEILKITTFFAKSISPATATGIYEEEKNVRINFDIYRESPTDKLLRCQFFPDLYSSTVMIE